MRSRTTNEQRFEFKILRVLLVSLGLAAMAIALLVFFLGVGAVTLVENAYDALAGRLTAPSPIPSATLDSELRFYAPFWFGYGLLLLWVARTLGKRLHLVPLLALPFFLGGIGRLLSFIMTGPPHPSFQLLMWIELLLPPIFFLLYWRSLLRSE